MSLLSSLAYLLSQQDQGKYYSAVCPDDGCRAKLVFPSREPSVECPSCGQRHSTKELPDKQVLGGHDQVGVELAQLKQLYSTSKKTPELVRVKGISNYQCKLLSPLLTEYGMDHDTARLLQDMGKGATFDCSKLSGRVFAIEEPQLSVAGYGRDRSGSMRYLSDTLKQLQLANNGVECLVPIHADGDGHCLVHAISRCLVGRELFWHALRTSLQQHFSSNITRYKELFKDFYSEEDWPDIVAEAGPDFRPPDGQAHGLRNIHIFGLANVLRRPVILLDSLSGMHSSGDYSGIFLPTLHSPEECSAGGQLNSPIVIAWSSCGRNHFIPLVPVKGQALPVLPACLRPKVWGQPEDELQRYVRVDGSGSVQLYAGKELGDKYLLKLVGCMDRLFFEKYSVVTSLVADVDQYVYKGAGCVGLSGQLVTQATHSAVQEKRLFRCLMCSALSLVPPEWLKRGGLLHTKAQENITLEDGMTLNFPFDGVTALYNAATDTLLPLEVSCFWCTSATRLVCGDGSVVYCNGDRTSTTSSGSRCGCGYMHYWDGKEYDNLPEKIPLSLTWAVQTKQIVVYWFQYESDPSKNSNVYEVAQKAVSDHFPGEFGSERLVQRVVELILASTDKVQVAGHHPTSQQDRPTSKQDVEFSEEVVTKFIVTGPKSKTLHKEELTVSNTERLVRKRVEDNAKLHQHKTSKSARVSPSPALDHNSKLTERVSKQPGSLPKSPGCPPSSGRPSKRIRVTSSDGRSVDLTFELNVTFTELQATIEKELNISVSSQRLRSGFPPRELLPPQDPSQPVPLSNGERLSVEIVSQDTSGPQGAEESSTPSTETEAQSLNALLQQMLGGGVDLWSLAQHQAHMFSKGGDYYKQVVSQYGHRLKNNTHFQFKEFPSKTFAYNEERERLEVCLGMQHVEVRPLTVEQEHLAMLASQTSTESNSGGAKPTQLKAFSGRGHTLAEPDKPFLGAAQAVLQKRLLTLQSRERELHSQVRAVNRQLVSAEARQDSSTTALETKLLDISSQLKEVREEISQLNTF